VELAAMDDPPRILGDRQQLRQVFLNLILNAVEASDRGGKMQVLVHPSDEPDHLSVKVIDYGSGIPAKILPRIFEPFFTTKETGKGTGLGLSVSEGIIAKHSGHVKVDSREGKGTTFTVILPVTTLS
jgi:signal transduction histidine kinase